MKNLMDRLMFLEETNKKLADQIIDLKKVSPVTGREPKVALPEKYDGNRQKLLLGTRKLVRDGGRRTGDGGQRTEIY